MVFICNGKEDPFAIMYLFHMDSNFTKSLENFIMSVSLIGLLVDDLYSRCHNYKSLLSHIHFRKSKSGPGRSVIG